MTNILYSENLQSKVERYEQRLSQALRTAENRFYNGLEQQKAGGIWDEDTGLIRFGVRDYDSETGRWTSVEPLGFSGSRNWYVYAGNDGVNFVDLDGRFHIPKGYTFVPLKDMTYQDKLARYMLQKLICKSIEDNKEYGGTIAYNDILDGLEYLPGKSGGKDNLTYPKIDSVHMAIAKLHTHGCWMKEYVKNGIDYNNTYSDKDVDLLRRDGDIPNYLGNTIGEMLYLGIDSSGYLEGKVFPDLDLSKCKCPDKKPYNTVKMKNNCGN